MTDCVADGPDHLDPDQEAVIHAPVSARLVVTAGPGTGKTRTLLARAEWLADQGLVEPGAELLILSFSRAAVETVARRGFGETALGRLPVRTFDSFAASLLIEAGFATDQGSYDGRIHAATMALDTSEATNVLASIKHVLIDEAQDVVGVRAAFVCALLEVVCRGENNGFTIFGDEAQAVYDWQLGRNGGGGRLLSAPELTALDAKTLALRTNYRMEPERLLPLAEEFGERIRAEDDPVRLRRDISEEVFFEAGWMDVDDAVAEVRATYEAPARPTVAVLCRTNAEVLWLGSRLQSAGLDVRVQHRAEDRGGAAWLASLFGRAKFKTTTIPEAGDSQEKPAWMQPPSDLVRVLRQAGLARRDDVDLGRLASLLRSGACPEELVARRDAAVTVSTIHRAKGLEFDTVFVVQSDRPVDDADALDEARVLFVAATRARDAVLAGAAIKFHGPVRQADDSARATICSWKKVNRPTRLEVRVSDSAFDWAPESGEDYWALQRLLEREFSPGDEVELRLIDGRADQGEPPMYEAVQTRDGSDRIVGRTTKAFGEMLSRALWGRSPTHIKNLTAEIPDTAAMSHAIARRVGAGDHGLHLRARFFGLGQLWWGDD